MVVIVPKRLFGGTSDIGVGTTLDGGRTSPFIKSDAMTTLLWPQGANIVFHVDIIRHVGGV